MVEHLSQIYTTCMQTPNGVRCRHNKHLALITEQSALLTIFSSGFRFRPLHPSQTRKIDLQFPYSFKCVNGVKTLDTFLTPRACFDISRRIDFDWFWILIWRKNGMEVEVVFGKPTFINIVKSKGFLRESMCCELLRSGNNVKCRMYLLKLKCDFSI